MYIMLAPFRLNEGVGEQGLLEASDRYETDFVARQAGIDQRILVRAGDGGYADLVFFRDQASADRVVELEATSEACAAFGSIMQPPPEDLPDMGVLSFEHLRTYESRTQPAVECVLFNPVSGVERDDLVGAAASVSEWARSQPGFVSRELFEIGDGRWIDIVRWATIDDALTAADAAMSSDTCAGFFALLDMESLQLLHGTPALPVVRS